MKENIKSKIDIEHYSNLVKEGVLNFIVPLVCLVLTVVLFVFVIYPGIKNVPELEKTLSEKQVLYTTLDSKVKKLQTLESSQDEVQTDLQFLSDILVSEEAVPQLLTQITQIASESGVQVKRLTYAVNASTPTSQASSATQEEESSETSKLSSITVTLGALGDYNQIIAFLKNLENSARIINVSNFRFTSQTDEANVSNAFDFTFVINSPYLTVKSDAVTDDPIALDIDSTDHQLFMNEMAKFKVYKITEDQINQQLLEDLTQSTQTPPAETTPDVVPEAPIVEIPVQ